MKRSDEVVTKERPPQGRLQPPSFISRIAELTKITQLWPFVTDPSPKDYFGTRARDLKARGGFASLGPPAFAEPSDKLDHNLVTAQAADLPHTGPASPKTGIAPSGFAVAAASSSIIQCPAGHALRQSFTNGSFICDFCSATPLPGDSMWTCEACDYDKCFYCRKMVAPASVESIKAAVEQLRSPDWSARKEAGLLLCHSVKFHGAKELVFFFAKPLLDERRWRVQTAALDVCRACDYSGHCSIGPDPRPRIAKPAPSAAVNLVCRASGIRPLAQNLRRPAPR